MPPPGNIAVNSPNANAAIIIGIIAINEAINVAYPISPATAPTENIAVPDTTNPTAAPYAGVNPRTRFNFVFLLFILFSLHLLYHHTNHLLLRYNTRRN